MSSQRKARVLIVDDHREMAQLLYDQLTDAGYLVEAAQSGAEALAKAKANLPDVVLTDLRMEQVDGFDVLEGMHALDPTMPVMIMTAFGAIETAIEAQLAEPTEAMSASYRALEHEHRELLLAMLDSPPGPVAERDLAEALRRHASSGLPKAPVDLVDRLADHFLKVLA